MPDVPMAYRNTRVIVMNISACRKTLLLFMLFFLFMPSAGNAIPAKEQQFVTSEDGKAWYFDPLSVKVREGDMLSVYVQIHYPAVDLKENRLWFFNEGRDSFKELDSYTYTMDGIPVDQ